MLCSHQSHAFRGVTRCFEYLGACRADEVTPKDGDSTFTKAFIWALKELKDAEGFFSDDLLAKIRLAPNFTKYREQPQLYSKRFEMNGEYLYITPKAGHRANDTGISRKQRDEEFQQEELLELRFHFDRLITDHDLKTTIYELKELVHKLRATHVSLVGKYTMKTRGVIKDHRTRRWGHAWLQRHRSKSHGVSLEVSPTEAGHVVNVIPTGISPHFASAIHESSSLNNANPDYPRSPDTTDEERRGQGSTQKRRRTSITDHACAR